MPVVAIFTFINREFRGAMVVGSNLRSEFGFFFGVIADFMHIADPAALWLIGLIWV